MVVRASRQESGGAQVYSLKLQSKRKLCGYAGESDR